ncbi:MAG: ABC transporter ATP-binding protein [Paracoccus sp. (in: a-proteobacteria)]|nr:ABC transporter ATP-binding protein [Paracoccus sp. (in: a-proteobacteria)]
MKADDKIQAQGLVVGYGGQPVCRGVDLDIPPGGFTVIVGPNGCGKSTLLRSMCRLLTPDAGQVLLAGHDIARLPARELARRIGLLPQSAEAPAGITVADLVARGRYPHQGFFRQWSEADSSAVTAAMTATGVAGLADRQVDHLSGGQRQRVWVAMALAQQTPILFLDEPTTYLDIAHQVDLLDLLAGLHEGGRTLAAVLHDLNQACRYATSLVVMSEGRIVAQGVPDQVMTPGLMRAVFGLDCLVIPDPVTGRPMIVPKSRTIRPGLSSSVDYKNNQA